ncbi:hypothetical protein QTG54_009815 [Skeletonema marinoi]|uniref:Calmodulin n=1 Tax=Skeletonema marinoi TaxID=267567 RepID=A0AAD9D9P1_9STRA|nr:hypothetical protein QTG54_009815 [Skeletonema marinoi]
MKIATIVLLTSALSGSNAQLAAASSVCLLYLHRHRNGGESGSSSSNMKKDDDSLSRSPNTSNASFLRASKRDDIIEKDDKMYSDFVERDGFQHAIPINIDDIDDIPEEIRRIFRNRPKFPPTDGDELDFELAEKNLDDDFPDYIPEDIKKLLKKSRERSGGDGVIRPKIEFVDYEDPEDFKFEKAGGDKTSEDGKTSRKSSTTTSSKDESKCVGRYRNKEAECRASSKCVWNDSREKCEDEGTMNEVDFLEPAQQNYRGRIPDDINEQIKKLLKKLGKVPDSDELDFELAEKSLDDDCPDDVPDDYCEDIIRLLKKLREAFGPKFGGDGDGIIRPKAVTAMN